MAGSVEKILLVVGIHEGHGFPTRNSHLLTVEARLAGEVLETDPVEHCGRVDFSTELAWEMSHRSLQQHRLKRTPIKLVCFAVDKHSSNRQEVGYALLDLRSAQQRISTQVNGRWHLLLNCLYSGKKPELRLSLTTEADHPTASPCLSLATNRGPTVATSTDQGLAVSASPVMVLDERGGWYLIGSPCPQQLLHTISLTLSHPHNLHMLLGGSPRPVSSVENGMGMGPYHFSYTLLGNEIHTEPFTELAEPCSFQAERASVRVKATPNDIHTLLSKQPDVEISLCCSNGTTLCSGHVPIQMLSSSSSFSLTCSLSPCHQQADQKEAGQVAPTVNVALQIHGEEVAGPLLNGGGRGGSLGSIPLLHVSPQTQHGQPQEVIPGGFARRNLAQSFEDASNSSGHSSLVMTTPPHAQGQQTRSRSSTTSPATKTTPPHHPAQTSPQGPLLPAGGPRKISPASGGAVHLSPSYSIQAVPSLGTLPVIHVTTTAPSIVTHVASTATSSSAVPLPATSSSWPVASTVLATSVPIAHPVSSIPMAIGANGVPPNTIVPTTLQTTATTQAQTAISVSAMPPIPMVHLATGVPVTHLATDPPVLSSAAHSTIVQQQMEYQAAMELEMWKLSQEQNFLQSLKEKEETHLKILGDEFQKRDQRREELLKQKLEQYQSLEGQLGKTLSQLEKQRVKLKEREEEVRLAQHRISEEKRCAQGDLDHRLAQLKSGYETRLEVERIKSNELSTLVDRLKRQVREVEERCSHKEAEFNAFREQLRNEPESQLRAQTSLMQIEKLELQHKLDSALKSKQHYKEQWTKAIHELAALKQKEQGQMREKLRQQQQELETMREKYLVSEEQQSLRKQLTELRKEANRLQSHTLAKSPHSHKPSSHAPHAPSLHSTVDSDITRWIEERDILLQTGVYSSFDPTIQKLDQKIRDALAVKSSTGSH